MIYGVCYLLSTLSTVSGVYLPRLLRLRGGLGTRVLGGRTVDDPGQADIFADHGSVIWLPHTMTVFDFAYTRARFPSIVGRC